MSLDTSVVYAVENRAVSSGRDDVVYLTPAKEPYEALPLGNGNMGVMVSNLTGMNYVLYPGNFFASAGQNQLLIASGELTIHLPEEWMKGFVNERLELYNARIVTKFKTINGIYEVTSWVIKGMNVLVIEIKGNNPIPDLKAELTIPNKNNLPVLLRNPKITVEQGKAALTTMGLSEQRVASLLVEKLNGQFEAKSDGNKIAIDIPSDGRKKLILLVASPVVCEKKVSSNDALNKAQELIGRIQKYGISSFRKSHNAYWHSFWSKSSITMHSRHGFADYLENLYNLFLYMMADMSTGPDAPKFNGGDFLFLNNWRSWGGEYWYNNTREMYWPLLPSNHADLWKPFIDLYWRHMSVFKKSTHEFYGVDGICVPETMDGYSGIGDNTHNPYTCLYLTSGTELAYEFYRYYLYTHDETFLKEKAYPMMKDTITFELNFLTKGKNGIYHVYPSDARETYWWIKDSITTLSSLKCVLPILIDTSKKLGVDEKERIHWQYVLDHLAPFVIDKKTNTFLPGTFLNVYPPTRFTKVEAVYPINKRTNKSGNAFNCEDIVCDPVYPWGLIGLNSSQKELEIMRNTYLKSPWRWWGYGNAWNPTAVWAARLGMTEEVVKRLREYVNYVQMFPNGMASTPGRMPKIWGKQLGDSPGFDSAGVMATTIQQMMLQSYDNLIRIFPAWPNGWQCEFTLLAQGGFLVSSSIGKNGNIPMIKIFSQKGGVCSILNPWKGDIKFYSKTDKKILKSRKTITFSTLTDGLYILTPVKSVGKISRIKAIRNTGPKWPQHINANDTAEDYLKRDTGFGFLGITKDGQNATLNMVQRALRAQKKT